MDELELEDLNHNNNTNNSPTSNTSDIESSGSAEADLEKFLESSTSSSSYTITSCSTIKHVHTWRVSNFNLLPFNKTEPLESLKFQVGPTELIMRCFPFGRAHESNDRCSVFIQLVGLPKNYAINETTPNSNSINTNNNSSKRHKHSNNNNSTNRQPLRTMSSAISEEVSTAPLSPAYISDINDSNPLPTTHNRSGAYITIRYRMRYVYPSGDRSRDEVIPQLNKPPYQYQFAIGDECEGSYVTKPALEQRGFLKNDTLILQAEIELMLRPVTMLSFSHSLPIIYNNSSNHNSNFIGKQFKEMWDKEEQCDIAFKIVESNNNSTIGRSSSTNTGLESNENCIPAHKFVLSARSEVFAAMFRAKMHESTNSIIELNDIDGITLLRLLYHLYTGELPIAEDNNDSNPNEFGSNSNSNNSDRYLTAISSQTDQSAANLMPSSYEITPLTTWLDAMKLYSAAVKYCIDYLCELCAWKITETLAPNNVLITLQFAEYHRSNAGALTIRSAAKNFLLRRFDDVIAASTDHSAHKQFFQSFVNIQKPINLNEINEPEGKNVQSLDENDIGDLSKVQIYSEENVIAEGQLLKWTGSVFNTNCPSHHAAVLIQSIISPELVKNVLSNYPPLNESCIESLKVAKIYFLPHKNIQLVPLKNTKHSVEDHNSNSIMSLDSYSNNMNTNSGSSIANASSTKSSSNNNNSTHSSPLKRTLALDNLNSSYNLTQSSSISPAESNKRRRKV